MSAGPAWLSAAAILVSPFLAALLSGYWVQRWLKRNDYVEARVNDLCDTAEKIADLGSEYWAAAAQADPALKLKESKIVAAFSMLAGLRVMLSDLISEKGSSELREAEQRFFREVTGGDFGVHNRQASVEKVVSCQHEASRFIVAVRRSRLADLRGFRIRR
jgi:hypothetical protein